MFYFMFTTFACIWWQAHVCTYTPPNTHTHNYLFIMIAKSLQYILVSAELPKDFSTQVVSVYFSSGRPLLLNKSVEIEYLYLKLDFWNVKFYFSHLSRILKLKKKKKNPQNMPCPHVAYFLLKGFAIREFWTNSDIICLTFGKDLCTFWVKSIL